MQNFMDFNPRNLDVFKAPEVQTEQSLIYKAMPENSTSEDGIYRSEIRILYNVYDIYNSIIEKQTYALRDEAGFFRVDSALSVGDRNCPIFKSWKKLHYSQVPGIKELGNAIFDKQFSRWCLIQVVNDTNRPELNNKYMFFKLPKFLWETLNAKMNPSPESKKTPIPVMDFLLGRIVSLEVTPGPDDPQHPERKKREIKYTTSEITDDIFPIVQEDGTSFLTEDEQGILDSYIDMLTAANKTRDAKKRDAALEKLKADPITTSVANLYTKVATELQKFCPNLGVEIGYNYYDKAAGKFWDDATTARVMAFCAAAEEGRDPSKPKVENICEAADKTEKSTAEQPKVVGDSNNTGEDLPF